MARSVEDLALLYQVIAGPDGHDTEVPPVPVAGVPARDLKRLRIAFAPTIAGYPIAAEIRAAVEEVAAQLGPHCQVVEAAPLPGLDYDKSKFSEMWAMPMGAFQSAANKPTTTLAQYLEALHRRDQYIIAWERFFEVWDALLCPVAMVTAFPHCETGSPLGVDGQKVNYWMANAPCLLFNYTGHPAVVLPFKRDRDGLPIGIQIVGKRWDESRLLAIAQSISAVTGEFQRPPAFIAA